VRAQADRKLWAPGVVAPAYLDGKLAGDAGFDPLGFGSDPKNLKWFVGSELVHCRWAMLAVAGVLVQEIVKPDIFFYEAGLPQNLPEPFTNINMGGLLAFEFFMMHFVETLRGQDIITHGSVNGDPIFTNNAVANPEPGYPGFDPLGFSKGDGFKSWQYKEVVNGRLAMLAFMGFVVAGQATGKGPIDALITHVTDPFSNNIGTNIGTCTIPSSIDVEGVRIPLTCLWPGHPPL